MNFLQIWLPGYTRPGMFVEALRDKPAPHWGLWAQILRSLIDSLLLYLPLALMGKSPPLAPTITLFNSDTYYTTLIWLTPIVFLAEWLLGGSIFHVLLRLFKCPSDIDQILNLTAFAGLVVGAFLLLWDWFWLLVGGGNQYLLGVSHLVIDVWWFVLVVVGLKRLLGVPVWLGITVSLLAFCATLPLAMLFMRSPI